MGGGGLTWGGGGRDGVMLLMGYIYVGKKEQDN